MNSNIILSTSIVFVSMVMALDAAGLPSASNSDQDCVAKFRSLLDKEHFQMPRDVASLVDSVNSDVDWNGMLKRRSSGGQVFVEAAKKHGRPDEGCKRVHDLGQFLEKQVGCIEDLDFEKREVRNHLLDDELISSYWRANVACKSINKPRRL